jgi:hypothetical protein
MIQKIKCKFGFHNWEHYNTNITLRSTFPQYITRTSWRTNHIDQPFEREIRRCTSCKRKEVSIAGDWMHTNKTEDWERREDRLEEILK